LQVNYDKTNVVFGKGIMQNCKEEVLITLDIRKELAHDKYLGLPTTIGRAKKNVFQPILDRIGKKINC